MDRIVVQQFITNATTNVGQKRSLSKVADAAAISTAVPKDTTRTSPTAKRDNIRNSTKGMRATAERETGQIRINRKKESSKDDQKDNNNEEEERRTTTKHGDGQSNNNDKSDKEDNYRKGNEEYEENKDKSNEDNNKHYHRKMKVLKKETYFHDSEK